MRNKVALGLLALVAWVLSATCAWAVSLGKIDVASHLGERFYAEVPLRLDPGESISNVYVQIATPSDYRILEVYRDPALNNITVDVKTDKRGPRVVLSSDSGIEAPFFNLVLKLRYERATHFKKFPIFLDIPKMAMPKRMVPIPTIKQGQRQVPIVSPQASAPVTTTVVAAKPIANLPGSTFTPFDGWARTSRYGPMVYGDTITTVAQRLRIDKRFTLQQVMMAIFMKNRAKFDHDNINLIRAGTFLDVPTSAEVEQNSPQQAHDFLARQERVWKQLIKQPKYAAIAEAQKNRYSKRVRVGERASGVASAPTTSHGHQGAAAQSSREGGRSGAAGNAAQKRKLNMLQQQLQQLQQRNSDLQGKLTSTQKQLADASASSDAAAAAAANAKLKRLQIRLARLQAQRDQALQKARSQPSPLGWLTYALLAVVVLLLLVIAYLMRREPSHPAAEYAADFESHPMASMGSMTEPQPRVESHETHADMFEEAPEIDVEEVPEFDGSATMQMSSADITKEFTDSIPDLTDEDTGKMEPFEQEIEEEPNPNVDYLAEADVYLRYGMEDEAVQQVKMALKLDPHNVNAHIKLVQVLKAKNDQAAIDEAVAKARQLLGGGSLQQFEEAVSNLDQVVDAFADTLPPTMPEEIIGLPETADETPAATEAQSDSGAAATSGSEADVGLDELDIEWPEFEDMETSLQEAESEATQQQDEFEMPSASTAESSAPPAQPETPAPSDKDFDLSDLEIPDTDSGPAGGEESRASAFVDTSDLEKTVAIDWSQETSVEMDAEDTLDETDAEDLLAGSVTEGGATAEPGPFDAEQEQKPEEQTPKAAASPDISEGIDLGDFDFDQIQEERANEPDLGDEFSSTIRTSSMTVEKEVAEEEPSFDISTRFETSDEVTEPAAEEAADKPKEKKDEVPPAAGEKNESGLFLDIGDDFDQTQKLDDLLSEFADESEKDGGGKKD